MYNDFVLVGPAADPAQTRGNDIAAALGKLARSGASFVSRGDQSGTHAAELRLWKAAGVDLAAAKPAGYKECGCGMGPALNIGSSSNAYVLTDRGTWLSFKNRGDLKVLVEGDKTLFNQYGVMVVNAEKHPHVKTALAQGFADWITSAAGQAAIAGYRIGGEQLFFPNAPRP
jgi:tungstate transport system substrate-binding protein